MRSFFTQATRAMIVCNCKQNTRRTHGTQQSRLRNKRHLPKSQINHLQRSRKTLSLHMNIKAWCKIN